MLSERPAANLPLTFRAAAMQDLPQIKTVYRKIVHHMNAQRIEIWDERYPCDFLEEDIRNGRLYLLLHRLDIVSAFALCGENAGAAHIDWEHSGAKALYLDRFAVEYGTRLLMMDKGACVIDSGPDGKADYKIDDLLHTFNQISIECGN